MNFKQFISWFFPVPEGMSLLDMPIDSVDVLFEGKNKGNGCINA